MSEAVDIAKLVGLMAAAFPNTQVTEATTEAYVFMLQDLPLDVLTAAVQQVMAESDFLPSIAKLRQRAHELGKLDKLSALEAWGKVKEQIASRGFYRGPKFDDPVIAKAVECIGWRTLCSSDNEPADRAHFARVYDNLVRREEQDALLLPAVRQFKEQTKALIAAHSMPGR
jgi:hypothetical protein